MKQVSISLKKGFITLLFLELSVGISCDQQGLMFVKVQVQAQCQVTHSVCRLIIHGVCQYTTTVCSLIFLHYLSCCYCWKSWMFAPEMLFLCLWQWLWQSKAKEKVCLIQVVLHCSLLIRNTKCSKCIAYSAYRDTLQTMKHKWLKLQNKSPSSANKTQSRCNDKWLNTPQKKLKLCRVEKKLKLSERKVQQMKEKIQASTKTRGVSINDWMT